jgi:molybdopterin molybdotransferase
MLAVQEAIERLRAATRPLTPPESVPVAEALRRALAEDVVAAIDVPPADNSAMDGYALRGSDWPGTGEVMAISQRITAGSAPQPLEPGTAARIFTGAELPEGADTVVMQENTEGAGAGAVNILELAELGANIRRRGQDVARGAVILERGTRLRAQELGQLASLGREAVECYRPLRVALISTGDELVEPGKALGPGQIYNSNRYTVAGLMQGWGFEMVDLGILRDDPAAIRAAMEEAAERADVIVTTGGVSVGEEDHVRDVVESLGGIDLWKIAIKPGKPFAFGRVGDTPFLGLPGNPVSVFVTLAVVARGFLFDCQGADVTEPRPATLPAAFDRPADSREDYLRVRVSDRGLELFPSQSSGVLTSLCWSDGLARQRPDENIRAGDAVDYFPFEVWL